MFEFFDERTYATIGEHGLENVEMSDYPYHSTNCKDKDKDHDKDAWDFKKFQKVMVF